MHTTVQNSFADFLRPMEGEVDCMYRDHLGLVTVGIGNVIDSPKAAWDTRNHGAPFVRKTDHTVEATQSEVFAEWDRVKNDESLIANPQRARDAARLVLLPQSILNLLDGKLSEFENTLKTHPPFASLDDWPADAQLGLFSMAWAMGSSFAHHDRWPNFSAAVGGAEPESQAAATQCNMANAWMARRNAVNRGLFRNAAWATGVRGGPRRSGRPGP